MIGLDTNVLLRCLTSDDPRQSPTAQAFLGQAEVQGRRLYINTVVLCELAWTLSGRIYRFDRHAIAAAIEKLLETPLFEFQSRDLVRLAVVDYREGRAGFADYLIGRQNAEAGCAETVTFDTSLAPAGGFSLLE